MRPKQQGTGASVGALFSCWVVLASTASVAADVQFVDVGVDRGILPYTPAHGMGSGLAAADYDDDGDVDLFVPTGEGTPHRLYRNHGDGTFEDVADAVGLDRLERGRTALWLDVDGDHRLDLFVAADCFGLGEDCPDASTLFLFRQRADGSFEDQTIEAGFTDDLVTTTGQHRSGLAAGDIDRDGDLDLIMGMWAGPARVFRNDGDGTFTEISPGCGIGGVTQGHWQPVMFDFDGDGWTDIFSAIDFAPNHLWINQRDGTFVDMAKSAGVDHAFNDMGVALGDYDNDGDVDIYVSEIFDLGRHNLLYRNDTPPGGALQFTEVAHQAGVENTDFGWGTTFLDANRDGVLDLAVTNGYFNPPWDADASRFFMGSGGDRPAFVDASVAVGFADTQWGSSLLAFDADRDGDLDLVQSCMAGGPLRLLDNRPAEGNDRHWLLVRPRMAGPNHRAIGAVVRVRSSAGAMMRVVLAGSSHLGQEPAEAFFGLDDTAVIDCLQIDYPLGERAIVRDVAVDRVLTIEPTGCGGADVDRSGEAGFEDLLAILGAWGPCPETVCCSADLDGNGEAGFEDILALLSAWGSCGP